MAALDITLLGGFEARCATGEPIRLAGRKAQALLARLAMTPGETLPREKLVALLWSDRGEEQARGSLRAVLTELRRALDGVEPMPLVADRETVTLDVQAVEVDVASFEQATAEGTPEGLACAAGLYTGDLLDGFAGPDPAFDDWLRDERTRLRERAIDALTRLLNHQISAHETEAAIATARRLLALDPLQEAVHRSLMRLYAETGDRSTALRQYQACRDVLKAELGIAPEAETERLAKEIGRGVAGSSEDADEPGTTAALVATPKQPPLPDKPSIAVLPFVNLSGDAEQEYFSDGITGDIITKLTRFRSLFVIGRQSSFTFKGKTVDVIEVGIRLGVRYVVEGSVQKLGSRVRVTAELVEAATGNNLWAEHYDRELEDIFAVQDEVVDEIAAAIPGRLDLAAHEYAKRKPPKNLTAYDYVLRGEWLLGQDFGSREAFGLFEKAIEIDPQCARAYTRLAAIHAYSIYTHGASVDEGTQMARSFAERALEIDPADPVVQATAAVAYLLVGEHDLARRHIDKAIRLNPNDYVVMLWAGLVLGYLGDHEKALIWRDRISRHDPFSGDSYRETLFDVPYMARRYDRAIEAMRGWRNPPNHMYAELAAAYAQNGQPDAAQSALETYRRELPEGYDTSAVCHAHARMCARQEDREHWLEGYRKAGLEV